MAVATSPSNEEIEYLPFYSVQHGRDPREQRAYWYAARRPAGYADWQCWTARMQDMSLMGQVRWANLVTAAVWATAVALARGIRLALVGCGRRGEHVLQHHLKHPAAEAVVLSDL